MWVLPITVASCRRSAATTGPSISNFSGRRLGIGRKAGDREQVLNRSRNPLQRTGMRTDGKSRVGGVGAAPRIVWRPLRIGHQLAAEPLVIGDCGFNERAGFELARGKT